MVEQGWIEEGGGGKLSMASSSTANQRPLPKKVLENLTHLHPLAKYEDIVPCPKLFMDTLGKLHATMGTKFMIPIIGGKDLDLHRLFVEVTSRGGIEKVIRERKWKEVTAVFNFPSSATNASFILRKYYVSLLHPYEQIYYPMAKGQTSLSADAPQNESTTPASTHGLGEPVQKSPEIQAAPAKRQRIHKAEFPGGTPVVGVIDGKFESGYLITVTIGSQTLKGVLHHPASQILPHHGIRQDHHVAQNPDSQIPHHGIPQYHQVVQNSASQIPPHPGMPQYQSVVADIGDNTTAASGERRRRRKKCEMKKRDPDHPKPNRSGYNFFFAEQHARLKLLHPGKDRDISRMIGELWNKLKESEKAVYQEKAMRDKERYRLEMDDYKERLKTGQIISDAVPLQQRPLELHVNMMGLNETIEAEGGNSPHTTENEFSSGRSDKSNFEDDKTADKDSEIGTSLGAEIGAANVGMETSSDEEAFELCEKVVHVGDEGSIGIKRKIGDEGEECLVDDQAETKKELLLSEEKESVPINEKESVPNEERILEPGKVIESVPTEDQ